MWKLENFHFSHSTVQGLEVMTTRMVDEILANWTTEAGYCTVILNQWVLFFVTLIGILIYVSVFVKRSLVWEIGILAQGVLELKETHKVDHYLVSQQLAAGKKKMMLGQPSARENFVRISVVRQNPLCLSVNIPPLSAICF